MIIYRIYSPAFDGEEYLGVKIDASEALAFAQKISANGKYATTCCVEQLNTENEEQKIIYKCKPKYVQDVISSRLKRVIGEFEEIK